MQLGNINVWHRYGDPEKESAVAAAYLAENSASRQYQYFAPRYGWIRMGRRYWLQPLPKS
jgi:hypothetical protein